MVVSSGGAGETGRNCHLQPWSHEVVHNVYLRGYARQNVAIAEAMKLSDLDLFSLFGDPDANRTVRDEILSRQCVEVAAYADGVVLEIPRSPDP